MASEGTIRNDNKPMRTERCPCLRSRFMAPRSRQYTKGSGYSGSTKLVATRMQTRIRRRHVACVAPREQYLCLVERNFGQVAPLLARPVIWTSLCQIQIGKEENTGRTAAHEHYIECSPLDTVAVIIVPQCHLLQVMCTARKIIWRPNN